MNNLTRKIMPILIIGILILSTNKVSADDWFTSYGNISWADERVFLDNFAIYLNRNLEMNGYMVFYGNSRDLAKLRKRMIKAKNYLIQVRKVERERLSIICSGEKDTTEIILQPIEKGRDHPFRELKCHSQTKMHRKSTFIHEKVNYSNDKRNG